MNPGETGCGRQLPKMHGQVLFRGKEAKEGGRLGLDGKDVCARNSTKCFSLKAGQHSHVIETAEATTFFNVEDVEAGTHGRACRSARPTSRRILLQQQPGQDGRRDWVKDLPRQALHPSLLSKCPNPSRIGNTWATRGHRTGGRAKGREFWPAQSPFRLRVIGNPHAKRRAEPPTGLSRPKRCLAGDTRRAGDRADFQGAFSTARSPFHRPDRTSGSSFTHQAIRMMLAGGPLRWRSLPHMRHCANVAKIITGARS